MVQQLTLAKNTTKRNFQFSVKIQHKVTRHRRYRQSSEPIKSQSNHVIKVASHKRYRQSSKQIKSQRNHVIGANRGKTCVRESRLVGFSSDWTSNCKWRECFSTKLVQSLNSPFFPPHIGAETGRVKEESRITCMRMLRTNQPKITRSQPRRSRQCVAQCLFQLALSKK